MSGYLSIYCPNCHKHTSVDPAPAEYTSGYSTYTTAAVWKKNHQKTWWIGVCNACKEPVLVLNDGEKIFPTPIPKPTDVNVPEEIRNDLNEAKLCFSVAAYRASAVMARRAMQNAATQKGATSSQLVSQIAELKDKGIITNDLKDWADAVRWIGNDAAHPNKSNVAKAEAEDVIHLAEQFLHVIYVAPALAASLRAKLGKT